MEASVPKKSNVLQGASSWRGPQPLQDPSGKNQLRARGQGVHRLQVLVGVRNARVFRVRYDKTLMQQSKLWAEANFSNVWMRTLGKRRHETRKFTASLLSLARQQREHGMQADTLSGLQKK
jgi:hypothetical protein